MREDAELLRAYAYDRSEEAFAELVRRRVGLVYAVALRRTGDAHRAQDVAQRVFTDLARKAAALAARPVLLGWLYRSAHYAASDLLRSERSRATREQEAHLMQQLTAGDPLPPDWDRVRPLLDEALNEMDERDRDAILLRFIDGRPFAEVGAQLQLSENAARMRVERALDKLRLRLGRRGVTSTMAALAAALGHPAMAAAPAGLAGAVTGAALTGAAAAGGTGTPVLAAFLMKTSTAVVGSVALLAAVGVAVFQTSQARQRAEELAALARERDGLTARLRAAEELGAREKQRAAAAEQATRLRTDAPATATPKSATPAPAGGNFTVRSGSSTATFGVTAGSVAAPDSPETRRKSSRYAAGDLFGAMFQRFGWTEAQREQFKDLMADRNEFRSQLMASAFPQGGPIDRAAAQKVFDLADRDFEAKLRAQLGGAAADAYSYFEETGPLRSRAGELMRSLFSTDAPLTFAQAEQLVDLMASHARNSQGKIDQAALNTEAVVAQAPAVLTPPQLAKFREMEWFRANSGFTLR